MGHTGLHNISFEHGIASTGSIIGDPRGRGNGCGTEAKLLLLRHAFIQKGLRKVTSTVKAFNGASLGHLLKCGYKPVGRYRKHHFSDGVHVDELLLEVFREEWEPIWTAYQATKQLPKLTDEQRAFVKETVGS